MNILVTGSNGQLGNSLRNFAANNNNQIFYYDLPELDITQPESIVQKVVKHNIQVIINCAAYTAVDKAEEASELAHAVNVIGSEMLAQVALKHNILLIHISTDYVFNGIACSPYKESDAVSPIGVYGFTKWQGEEKVRQTGCSHIIIRTSWLYSCYGNNFMKTMLKLGSTKDELGVVFDQIGTPTCAIDLAFAIVQILQQINIKSNYAATYHFSNEGCCSWYDFATAIMDIADLPCQVNPIETSAYPTLATRPSYSVLNKSKIKQDFNIQIPHWRVSLKKCIYQFTNSTI